MVTPVLRPEVGTAEILASARRLGDELLFPAAIATDLAPLVPKRLLDEMASAGMYGLTGPAEAGGLAATPDVCLHAASRGRRDRCLVDAGGARGVAGKAVRW
jgi:alkylation response protein AidB-like acyl-CoA dehydrogenase